MFASAIIFLTPFLIVTFLPLALQAFSCDDLDQMGVRLESLEMDRPHELFQGSNHVLPNVTVTCMNL